MLKNYFLNKRIVITGASSGIGQALSYWYLNQGSIVILVGKDEITLKSIASQYPTQATVVVTNITDDYQCKVSQKLFLALEIFFQFRIWLRPSRISSLRWTTFWMRLRACEPMIRPRKKRSTSQSSISLSTQPVSFLQATSTTLFLKTTIIWWMWTWGLLTCS